MPLIDVHSHWLPRSYLDAMETAGIRDVEGFPLPHWDAEEHLAVMERQGIASSILSISAPGIGFLSGRKASDFARRLNEEAAELRDRTGGRFGAFAIVSLPDVDAALREMEYALDVLHLDGVGLLTNIGGTYLGDPAFDAFFDEADRRRAVIYTHPVAPVGYERLTMGFSASSLEYPFDTTRMILNLVASGTLRRCRNLRLIASHGGGTMPYLGWRMKNVAHMFNRLTPEMTPEEASELMAGLYCDATAVLNPQALASYKLAVPEDRRLYGSDTPFMTEDTIPVSLEVVRADASIDAAARDALEHGNAARLFPRIAALLERDSIPVAAGSRETLEQR